MPEETTDEPAMSIGDVSARLRPGRRITGMSAVLLPHDSSASVDWTGLRALLERTVAAGLVPAVNMDTGFTQLLDDPTRHRVLDEVAAVAPGLPFVAGAFVADAPGAAFDGDGYRRAAAAISERGGTPMIFPSHGLNAGSGADWLARLADISIEVDRFYGFELGDMFVPHGRIYDLDTYRGLLDLPACVGAKHSSLDRVAEWRRLAVRDEVRPDFLVLTGNDLAIDMVMYGSDYLLGLSTFAPDVFAERDRRWAAGDPTFFELNDLLQYLGHFAFRSPVPGYRHNAAMTLALRGWIASDEIPAAVPRRPAADVEVLRELLGRLIDAGGEA